MLNYCHRQMKEEEGKLNDAMDSLKEERGRKSAAAALDSAERQAEGQRVLLRSAEDQLATSKAQVVALKKKLEETEAARVEAEKARDQAEQEGYDVGVAETEEALRVEVFEVCRTYYRQVWIKALNQAGVEASSILRKVESVYYPAAIRPSLPSLPRFDPVPEKAETGDGKAAKTSTPTEKGSEVVEQATQEVAPDAPILPIVIQDNPVKEAVSKGMEIVLASFPFPALVHPIGKGQASKRQKPSEVAAAQTNPPPPKDKIIPKKK
ncbi:hypothetical protein SO802_029163 [Lithocarpus litseifolius]|uniref:Uncharacterized protein n=1 Tax=Lithocarpus litseifolius TaxID=425828 RepID=A0AAW2BVU4_9ROSI